MKQEIVKVINQKMLREDNMERFSHVLSYLSHRINGHSHEDAVPHAKPYEGAVQHYATLTPEQCQKEHDSLSHRFNFIMDINDLFD